MAGRLLIAGGETDPSIGAIHAAACRLGVETLVLSTGSVALIFDPLTGVLWQDANEVQDVAAAFMRGDVFGSNAAASASVMAVLRGWMACHTEIRRLNHFDFGRSASVNKLSALAVASRHGLAIPITMAGNDPRGIAAFAAQASTIRKPVQGGDYCRPLSQEDQTGALAIIAQERLIAPELRIYRVGSRLFGFEIRSAALDYRTDKTAVVSAVPVPEELAAKLVALSDEMRLDFCASDFKTCPRSGRWIYLETNAAPMIAAFGPELADAIVAHLIAARP